MTEAEMEAIGFSLDLAPSVDDKGWALATHEPEEPCVDLELYRRRNSHVKEIVAALIERHRRNGSFEMMERQRDALRWSVQYDPAHAGNARIATAAARRSAA